MIQIRLLDAGETAALVVSAGRSAYVHVVRGKLAVGGKALAAGDGAALSDEREIWLSGIEQADMLLFDLP